MGWKLITASQSKVDGWQAEAARLRAQLDTVSSAVHSHYGTELEWRSQDRSATEWRDLDRITAELEQRRQRDETDGSLIPGGSAIGAVEGYLPDAPEPMVSCMWDVGGDHLWQYNTVYQFDTDDRGKGHAADLPDHPVPWLVGLLASAAASVEATQARIQVVGLQRALRRARQDVGGRIGAVTLAPRGIGDATLPSSVTSYPCPAGYPDGLVLVADLATVTTHPASLVEDLLTVDDLLSAAYDAK